MPSKRILFLCNKDIKSPKAGGGTWESFRLMNKLTQRGHKVTVLCPRYPGSEKEEIIGNIRVVRTGNFYTFYLSAMLAYLRSKELREHDVIVEIIFFLPFFTVFYARKPLMSVCWHLPRETYFMELPSLFGRVFGYLAAAVLYTLEQKLFPKIYKRYPIFTFSRSTRSELLELGFPENRVFMVEYALARGIMFTSIGDSEEKSGLWYNPRIKKDGFPSVVYLGRIKQYKGLQDAVKAMNLVVKEVPDAHLFIIGRGEYAEDIQNLTKKLSLEDHVHLLGYVSTIEKTERLQRAHVLVMPSYREGFATPVFEALMCGTPSIVSDAAGVRDSVNHGETGFIFKTGDYEEMAKYLTLVLRDNLLAERLHRNTMNQAEEFLETWKTNEKKFLDLFEKKIEDICARELT